MPVQVVGAWELSWSSPLKELEQWEMLLREFNVGDLWMWPVSGVQNREQFVTLHERPSLNAILEELPSSSQLVFMEPPNSSFEETQSPTWLHEYEHPEDAVYVFGSAHFNPVVATSGVERDHVAIKTERDDGVLWPHQCLLVVLHDRMVKSWQ